MILPSESLGVVAYAANDLRVEPVPLVSRPPTKPSSRWPTLSTRNEPISSNS